MPTLQGDALTKVTLNLYTDDVTTLKHLVGPGYTTKVRELVRQYCRTAADHQKARERLHLKWPTPSTS